MRVQIVAGDDILAAFGNQIAALGAGDARKALARAVNRTTTTVRSRVIRAIVKQSSIPRAIVAKQVKQRLASTRLDGGALEGVVYASGRPISLKYFQAHQFSWGVRAKVYGQWQRFPHAFMGPKPGIIAPALHGNVFMRINVKRTPIRMLEGPSVPEEMIRGEAKKVFEETVATMLPERVRHEIGRLLPGGE